MFKKYLLLSVFVYQLINLSTCQLIFSQEVKFEEGVAYLSVLKENITAKKGIAAKSFTQPSNITVIDRKEIEALNASTVVDVIRFQQGVVVRDWTGSGKTVEVDFRGFGETGASNVLVLVNGRRTNNIDMSNTDWSQIPLDAVEKIEIIRGPSAVLYGDNATGGVINIITRTGIGTPKTNLAVEVGSFNTAKFKLGLSGEKNNASYNVIASRNSTDGFRENSGLTNTDINAFIVYNLPEVKTSIDIGYHTDRYGMPGSVSEAQWEARNLKIAQTPRNEAKTNDSYIQFSIEKPVTQNMKNEFTVSMRNRLSNSYWRDWAAGEDRKSDIIGVGNKVYFENPVIGSVVGGVEAYLSKQVIKNLDKNDIPLPGSTNIKKDSLAFYISDDIKLLSEKLYINAGARWELANYSFASTGVNEVKISSAAQAYSLGISYLFDDKTSVYAKWSSAFRMPKVDEYYTAPRPSWPASFNLSVLNQITKTIELGAKKIFNKKLSGNMSIFQTDTENEIYYNPQSKWNPIWFMWEGANENYKKTQRLGAEIGVTIEPVKILTVRTNYTYTDAKITEGTYKDKTVPAVPTHSLSLINTLNLSRFNINLSGNYVGERYFISDQNNLSKKLDAYVKLDTKFVYKLQDIKIFAGINNILDTKYAEYGALWGSRFYYPSPERNFFAGVEMSF